MAKDRQNKKDKQDKHGKANPEAWEKTRKVARKMRKDYKDEEWSKLPWREIRNQLRQSGDTVDMTKVPPDWTSESPQMIKMRTILQQAGFKAEGHLYRWEPAGTEKQ